ncbi:MAG: aminoacyl-tRNA hydrolase [Planctomycetaceae bacterium]|nr:aminoacyl-tRNA hydrolase [Planctomycetaceae bacterium]
MEIGNDVVDRRLVVGLGNPGTRYRHTRHNLGFRVVDELVRRFDAGSGRDAFGARAWDVRTTRSDALRRVTLLEPQEYMNRSGSAVAMAAGFYHLAPHHVLVVMDDLALPPGRLRARAEGSAGGHNGLADVMQKMGTNALPRLRIGIGPSPANMDSADYVLQAVPQDQAAIIEIAVKTAADAVEDWVFNGIAFVMDKYNGKAEE